jgi:cytochrome c peroxidase
VAARARGLLATLVAGVVTCADHTHASAPQLDASASAQVPRGPLTDEERARIVAFGPWPPVVAASPDPAFASRVEAVAMGELLFNSARLSGDGRLRCASCHEPWRQFAEGRARALGRIEGARNTPSLLDVGWRRTLGWDGTLDRLETQSLRPLRDPDEMAATPAHVAALVRGDPALRVRYQAAFGAAPPTSDETVFEDVGRALAAYEATLVSAGTSFDVLRDALAAAPAAPSRDLSAALPAGAALRGLRLFVGRAGCVSCHSGPAFSDDVLHVSTTHSFKPDGTPDGGRARGPANAFRTPTLRGVAATAPYMHDGHVESLCDAVRPHALSDAAPQRVAGPPALAARDRTDLVAFLRTLGAASTEEGEGGDDIPCRD